MRRRIQRVDLVLPYVVTYGKTNSFRAFAKMPPEVAEELSNGWPNINPRDRQGSSPSAARMIRLAAQYHGTLTGYIIFEREDARVSITGMSLYVDRATARKLYESLKPDIFDVRKGKYVFWWD